MLTRIEKICMFAWTLCQVVISDIISIRKSDSQRNKQNSSLLVYWTPSNTFTNVILSTEISSPKTLCWTRMVILELLISVSLATTRKKTRKKPVAHRVTWLQKYFASKIIHSQLTTTHLESLLMNAWWARDRIPERPDKKSEIRCSRSRYRSSSKTFPKAGQ